MNMSSYRCSDKYEQAAVFERAQYQLYGLKRKNTLPLKPVKL